MDNSATINTIIGIRINTLLAKNCVKQKELAKVLGVNDNVISYYCKGSRKPNIDQLNKIADFFHTSVDFLLGRTNVISTDTNIQMICEYTGLSEEAVDFIKEVNSVSFDLKNNADQTFDISLVLDIILKSNAFSEMLLNCYSIYNLSVGNRYISNYQVLHISKTLKMSIDDVEKLLKDKSFIIGDVLDPDIYKYRNSKVIEKLCDYFDNRVDFTSFTEQELIDYFNLDKQDL